MAGPDKIAVEQAKRVRAVVARGRTVEVDGKGFGPGETVSLPESEVAHLRKLGYFVAPVDPAPANEGVSVTQSEGPTVKGA
jgi:hypothetical protein